MDSTLIVYAHAADHLGFTAAPFDVSKRTDRVWKFHERLGAAGTAESYLDYFYRFNGKAIAAARERYRRFLPGSVSVVFS